jgi:16S rRNA (adenine(1408)-N(1))-methyltransferase
MRCVKGNKIIELKGPEVSQLLSRFLKVVIDLGTGDGRFVYKNASNTKDTLFIGIDPSEKQLEIYSKKANRNKIENALFVVGSVEILSDELLNVADELFINLPWGTLLEFVAKPTPEKTLNLIRLLKPNGKLEITFGYALEAEPSETARIELPEINENYVRTKIIPEFEKTFKLMNFHVLDKEDLKRIETTWGKKLSFGNNRPMFKLVFKKIA